MTQSGTLHQALLDSFDTEPPQPAEIAIQGLSCVIPANKKQPAQAVLRDVSCVFPPGKLSAIMGASGSGKTTILTRLRGLGVGSAQWTGKMRCNGRRVTLDMMRSVACCVPQEDTFLPGLTVFDTLLYVSRLRSPSDTREEVHTKRVTRLIQMLKLVNCQNTLVGDEIRGLRGISGGEKKRLSIGLSLVGGLPQALICDEPTSGLDSSAAAEIMKMMKGLAARGSTVISSIHQPSYVVFQEFAHVLLLHRGGTCFSGPVAEVEAYFKGHQAPTPPYTNPAQHYIRCVQSHTTDWVALWTAERAEDAKALAESKLNAPSPGCHVAVSGRRRSGFVHHVKVLTARAIHENFGNKTQFARGVKSRLPASIACGVFFMGIGSQDTQRSILPLQGILYICVQNPLIESFYASATTTQLTRSILKREYYDGLYTVAPYYISYYVGQMVMQIPWTFVWVVPIYLLAGMPLDIARFGVLVLTSFLVTLMSGAAGSAVGTFTKDAQGNRAVLGPIMIIIVLFSGYVIPYPQIPSPYLLFYYLSPVQWGMSILNLNHFSGVEFLDTSRDSKGFATGEDYLETSLSAVAQQLGIPGMLLLCTGYVLFFMLLNIRLIHRCVLDCRV